VSHPFREESEEHVIRRLEAFSDIVIGFSLAQMTLNLTVPSDALDLFTKNYALPAFGITFVVVAGLWWTHHMLFTHYFVPEPVNIGLNFASLGGVMFLVYTLQVWIRTQQHHWIAYTMYTASIAWVVGLNAIMIARGIHLRGSRMPASIANRGRWRVIRQGVIAVAFVALAVTGGLSHERGAFQAPLLVVSVIIVLAIRVLNALDSRRNEQRASEGTEAKL
jgi:uncharacterized membrane protein